MRIAPCRSISRAWPWRSATVSLIASPKRYELEKNDLRAPWGGDELQGLAPGGCTPAADEQSRSGRGGKPGPADRLRWDRSSGAELGSVRCASRTASCSRERRDTAYPSRQARR